MLMGLNARAWSLVLGISGLVFGLTGVFWLGVQIDWILFAGAALLVLAVLLTRREMAVSAART
jgi:drug/metabolite transporter (DMT)-like permease